MESRKIYNSKLQEKRHDARSKRAQYRPEEQLNGLDAEFAGRNALASVLHRRT
jgi:hypothetical protein